MGHTVVMLTTSYPRFPGDSVGTFMEPIAKSLARRGHAIHIVAPWHPLVTRGAEEDGVRFHFYRYAPVPSLNIFGYASSMRADVRLRAAAYVVAPLALAAGWWKARTVARQTGATIVNGHWVIPGGVTAWAAAPRLPLVISLHGSDVFVAETFAPARVATRQAFAHAAYVTACSDDLGRRAVALGADRSRLETIPYGVDVARFRPDAGVRAALRAELDVPEGAPLAFMAGRLVRKKGFEYAIDALGELPGVRLVLAGGGTLDRELRERASARGVLDRVRFVGNQKQDRIADYLASADVVIVPSVRDDSGNVDGLPNVVMESLASGTPLVTTAAGGIGSVIEDGRTAFVVPERDAGAIAAAVRGVLERPEAARRVGEAARALAEAEFGWDRTARQFEHAYGRALAFKSMSR